MVGKKYKKIQKGILYVNIVYNNILLCENINQNNIYVTWCIVCF